MEDDYDSEFRFGSRPLEPLRAMDQCERVLYVGTFSKSMLPTIRTGFVLAPPSLRPALAAARQLSDGHGHVAMQAALARFIEEGELARHVRRARREYAARYERIVTALAKVPQLSVVPSAAGLHVTALTESTIPDTSSSPGLAVDGLTRYGGDRHGLVLGFGAVDPATLDEGLATLSSYFK